MTNERWKCKSVDNSLNWLNSRERNKMMMVAQILLALHFSHHNCTSTKIYNEFAIVDHANSCTHNTNYPIKTNSDHDGFPLDELVNKSVTTFNVRAILLNGIIKSSSVENYLTLAPNLMKDCTDSYIIRRDKVLNYTRSLQIGYFLYQSWI